METPHRPEEDRDVDDEDCEGDDEGRRVPRRRDQGRHRRRDEQDETAEG
jgi:hypothetical protein